MLTYPWKCTVLHCSHLGNTWKPLVLMTRHFDYCRALASVRSSAPVVSRCFPGGYNVKLYISRGRLAWWLLAFLHSADRTCIRVGSEYFQSTRVRVLNTSEVLEYEYEYFSPFYKSTRVRVQSTQNVLMNTLMSTFRC